MGEKMAQRSGSEFESNTHAKQQQRQNRKEEALDMCVPVNPVGVVGIDGRIVRAEWPPALAPGSARDPASKE